MSVQQLFNRSVNRVFLLAKIKDIQTLQIDQTTLNYLIVETEEGWKDKFGNQKTQVEQHYVVLPSHFDEYLNNLEPNQNIMLQGSIKTKQQNQYPQFKCMSYVLAESIQNIASFTELHEMEVNDGLPFPKRLISLWSEPTAY
ncbi:single-stranded DNA-binding protein [Acinetobacter towneri]|uniref:Single-stranded DNA-binding protein n=1 Tax=Acinetobacter towneri TaxID=202956 RepID=A0A1E8DZ32_9GAMM|nr:single-stranded DNA-binding protein [Acinetobacter towneri]OFE42587.1 hypothetical protein BJN41_13565 [Acinetobacter towneri]